MRNEWWCVGPVMLALLAGCAAPLDIGARRETTLVELKNPGFERDPPPGYACVVGWTCAMHSDPTSYRFWIDESSPRNEMRSACIERIRDEYGLMTQDVTDPNLRGKRVRFSIDMRMEGVTGNGGGPWVQVAGGGGGYFQKLVSGTRGWERGTIEFTVSGAAEMLRVGAVLEGPGRLCLDDARLEILGVQETAR